MVICSICLIEINNKNNYTDIKLNCKHKNNFHIDCLNNWLKKKKNCPICRSKISNISKSIKLIDIYKIKYQLHISPNEKYRYIN